jgi:hypothetical protein
MTGTQSAIWGEVAAHEQRRVFGARGRAAVREGTEIQNLSAFYGIVYLMRNHLKRRCRKKRGIAKEWIYPVLQPSVVDRHRKQRAGSSSKRGNCYLSTMTKVV